MREDKFLLKYDGDCSFCKIWADYWRGLTHHAVDFEAVPSPESVELVNPNGEKFLGAAAVFRLLALVPGKRFWWWLYKNLPGFSFISELVYKFIAKHRGFFYRATRFLWGKQIKHQNYFVIRAIFLKFLALVYLVAFVSFGLQLTGLIGSEGILPAADYLSSIKEQAGARAYWLIPSIFWLNASDLFMHIGIFTGVIFAVLLFFGFFPRAALIALMALYLSFVSVGQVFMNFQWDVFLLEIGFLAILLSFTTTIIWLFRWLLFRIMFLSGASKLISGDPTWKGFTALDYHFETQPLPTVFAWFFHNLPEWILRVGTVGALFIQLVVPFLIFAPRRLRLFAAATIAGLETLILITGNYNFFNITTIALALFLLDDGLVKKVMPQRVVAAIKALPNKIMPIWGRSLIAVIVLLLVVVSSVLAMGRLSGSLPRANQFIVNFVSPLRIVNNYGLFAVMTTQRNEIELQGSIDGENWEVYEFKYKPDELGMAPRWVAPHQPRLDWQMWFAALNNFQSSPWFVNFVQKVLEGSPEVLDLLEKNPFPDSPPQFARAVIYKYEFTNSEERKETGNWWKRELLGLYFPTVSLSNNQ